MNIKTRSKRRFLAFIPLALTATLPPWFINFKAADPEYGVWWLCAFLLSCVPSLLLDFHERTQRGKTNKEAIHE